MPKYQEKAWISRGVKAKQWKISYGKSTGNPGGQLQKNRYPQHGVQSFFGKVQCLKYRFLVL